MLHALKTDPLIRDIPVILISVVDRKRNSAFGLAPPPLVKPFDREALIATVSRVVPDGRRILVVVDDPNVAELVRQLLEGEGYTIDCASTAPQGSSASPKRVRA